MVKVWLVVVTVKTDRSGCELPPVPLSVPVIVMVCRPVGTVMFAAVLIVKVVLPVGVTPPNVTIEGLKLQVAPAGRPEQLLGVKFRVPAPLTGAIDRVEVAD